MDASNKAKLLESAVATNDVKDLFRWYKAVSELSPFWTRQLDMYRGRQTTNLQGLTPWRVMSHILEKESDAPQELEACRLALDLPECLLGP